MLDTVRSKKLQLINGCEQLESKRGNKYFLRYEKRDALKPFRLCFLKWFKKCDFNSFGVQNTQHASVKGFG